MNFFRILPILAIGGIFTFIGCDSSNDVYNPDAIKEQAKNAFPVKDIDPNQTWETSSVCKASVSVNETAGEVYTIKVYTANPYNANSGASLLATSSVSNGQTTNIEFDIPAALQYVYVMKIDSKGYSSVIPVAFEKGTIKVVFEKGSFANAKTAMTRSIQTKAATTTWQPAGFPKEAPAGSSELPSDQWNGITANANYIVKSNITSINIGKPVNLYIQGEVSLSKLYINTSYWNGSTTVSGQPNIYILPGSKLTYGGNFDQGLNVYIGENASLVSTNIKANSNNIANAGTITATTMEMNGTANFINEISGQVTLIGKFSCENGTSIAVNRGNIVAGEFALAGSSAFYNESTGTITTNGKSTINSNNCVWDNEGTFKTTDMTIESASSHWINKCRLYVTNHFRCVLGNTQNTDNGLLMDAGSYVECGSLYADQVVFRMRNKAFFNVKGEAKFMHNPKGFIAEGNEYALLKMGSAVQEKADQGYSITYNGNLYIACDNHFAQGYSGSYPYIDIKNGALQTGGENANISIPSSNCNPGYNSKPDNGGNDTPATYAYAFEDMMKEVGDYDFNDVVLYVSVPYDKNGKKVIDVTLKAAGATKKLAVGFNNSGQKQTLFADVHEALGVAAGTLVNTGTATGTEKKITVEVASNFTLTEHGDFYITDGSIERHIPNFTDGFKPGDVPYGIRIASSNWKWPKERVVITEAYAGFAAWANDATAAASWYNEPINGKVY